MVVSRCVDCREMIGGDDHKLLSTNFRITKRAYEAVTRGWETGGSTGPLDQIPVPGAQQINPEELDPDTLKLKRAGSCDRCCSFW